MLARVDGWSARKVMACSGRQLGVGECRVPRGCRRPTDRRRALGASKVNGYLGSIGQRRTQAIPNGMLTGMTSSNPDASTLACRNHALDTRVRHLRVRQRRQTKSGDTLNQSACYMRQERQAVHQAKAWCVPAFVAQWQSASLVMTRSSVRLTVKADQSAHPPHTSGVRLTPQPWFFC